jgi:hypothetical protein
MKKPSEAVYQLHGLRWHPSSPVLAPPTKDRSRLDLPLRASRIYYTLNAPSFNSAFKLADSGGGFADGGHTYAPLKDGLATILRYRDGRMDIVSWIGGPDAPADVVYARWNLPLIVENGHLNPDLSDGPRWGATLGNAVQVWRSAVGIDRRGDLIHTVADDQTVASIAQVLRRAGAVRAMELDINLARSSDSGSVVADVDVAPLVLAAGQRLANGRADQPVGSSAG